MRGKSSFLFVPLAARAVFDLPCRPLEEDLSTGIAQGLIRPLDPRATSVMLIGVTEGLQYLQAAGAMPTQDDLPEAVSTLILSGLLAGRGAGGKA